MSWLLHLSDPHLGDPSEDVVFDDDKVQLSSQADLETSQRVMKRTLRALRPFVAEHGRPSAAVVSGDLTVACQEKGFSAFAELLAERSDVLPEQREKIIVVPGNHDVDWDEEPGSAARYAGFLEASRKQGCTTPLLDGVDFSGQPPGMLPGGHQAHVVESDGFLIVPLNSSNYCGVTGWMRGGWAAEKWDMVLTELGDGAEEARAQLRKLVRHDMARVSREQLEALSEHLESLGIQRSSPPGGPVRVAVIHHQLLPVSTREERKTFESLVNLGLVRQVLREWEFDVVLHGHKHVDALYWDFLSKEGEPLGEPSRRLLVVAAPAHFEPGRPALRALIMGGSNAASNLRVVTFAGAESHTQKARVISEETVALWNNRPPVDAGGRMVIGGRGNVETYARIRSLFELREGAAMHDLVCRIEEPEDALQLPDSYPPVPADDAQVWFSELVEWWQLRHSELVGNELLPFNHGERIYRRWGDQVERAITMLREREDSSRALISLISPRETGRYEDDTRPLHRGSYPAFALAEFSLEKRETIMWLDCLAHFRKQEMQYWWPVNVAELRLLQEKIGAGLGRGVRAGRITTVSAIALWRKAIPRVAVPELDRLVEQPETLAEMAMALAFPDVDFADARQRWRDTLSELAAEGQEQPPPRPALGHRRLLAELGRLRQALPENAGLASAEERLRALADRCDAHSQDEGSLNPTAVRLIREAVEQLRDAVEACLGVLEPTVEQRDSSK